VFINILFIDFILYYLESSDRRSIEHLLLGYIKLLLVFFSLKLRLIFSLNILVDILGA